MRSVLAVAAAAVAVFAVPAPARADGEYLRVTPSTIQAGYQVEIEGYCGDNVNPATVKSDAFGVVTITPRQDANGKFVHRGTATVPGNTAPKAYPVTMTCPSQQAATTTLHVVNYNVPSKGPKTGGGGTASNSPLGGNGLTVLGAGAVIAGAGLFLLRRRQRA